MNVLEDIKSFSKCQLKKVETRVRQIDGRELIESRDSDGGLHVTLTTNKGLGYVGDIKPDLQIGQILPFLSLGSQDSAHELNLLKSLNVTHILNVAAGVPDAFPGRFVYKHLALFDLPDVDIRAVFDECFTFIDMARNAAGHVFVHCNAGVSRSATIVVAYVMKHCKLHYEDAKQLVKLKRPSIRPNDGFVSQLITFNNELYPTISD